MTDLERDMEESIKHLRDEVAELKVSLSEGNAAIREEVRRAYEDDRVRKQARINELEGERAEWTDYAEELRTALAMSTSVLAGTDNTRPEVIVEENRALLRRTESTGGLALGDCARADPEVTGSGIEGTKAGTPETKPSMPNGFLAVGTPYEALRELHDAAQQFLGQMASDGLGEMGRWMWTGEGKDKLRERVGMACARAYGVLQTSPSQGHQSVHNACRELLELLGDVANLWPEIRQLQDGFMNGDPNFTAWDHSVRDRCIAMNFRLAPYTQWAKSSPATDSKSEADRG